MINYLEICLAILFCCFLAIDEADSRQNKVQFETT